MANKELVAALNSCQPLMIYNTTEELRFRAELLSSIHETGLIRRITRISPSSCIRWEVERNAEGFIEGWTTQKDGRGNPIKDAAGNKMLEEPKPFVAEGGILQVMTDMLQSMNGSSPLPDILWIANQDQSFNEDISFADMILNAVIDIERFKAGKMILLTGTKLKCPELLKDHCRELMLPLPSEAEISNLVSGIVKRCKDSDKKFVAKADPLKKFIQNAKGLTETEVQQSLAYSISLHNGVDEHSPEIVQDRKKARVKSSGILQVRDVTKTLADLGGCEHLKSWVEDIAPTFNAPEAAKKYGMRIPSGLLMIGPPGTGKSLTCEAIAGTLGVSFVRFDLGSCMNSLQGQSEANVREAFKLMAALSPCVTQLDEVEKMLGSSDTHNSSPLMIKGMILSWLEEKPEGIFVAMTCNDASLFNQAHNNALVRDKRVDATFFVDLPGQSARAEIFAIHLAKTGHPIPVKQLEGELASVTKGFSGAEIEGVVHAALRQSFKQKMPHPTVPLLVEIAKKKVPQSVSMKESISQLRSWVREGRALPAGAVLEDDVQQMTQTDAFNVIGAKKR